MNAITREKSKLGFIGVGYMGRPIAQRLLEAGFRLTAYDRHRGKAELIERSEQLLINIALAVGFADQAHFSRTLHALVGLTPCQFRRAHR